MTFIPDLLTKSMLLFALLMATAKATCNATECAARKGGDFHCQYCGPKGMVCWPSSLVPCYTPPPTPRPTTNSSAATSESLDMQCHRIFTRDKHCENYNKPNTCSYDTPTPGVEYGNGPCAGAGYSSCCTRPDGCGGFFKQWLQSGHSCATGWKPC